MSSSRARDVKPPRQANDAEREGERRASDGGRFIRSEWFGAALLATATFVAYLPVLRNGFVSFDDGDYITANVPVQAGLTLTGIKWAFATFHSGNWHPVTWLSHMLDSQIWGSNPAGHHFTSLLLHIVNSLLLFVFLRRWTGAPWRSLLVAGLFALHPTRVESVAWAAERKDVLSGFFFLSTLMAYGAYVGRRGLNKLTGLNELNGEAGKGAKGEKGGRGDYVAAVVLFALGLMSKPMLVTAPLVLLLLDYWPLCRVRSAECGVRNGKEAETAHPESLEPQAPLWKTKNQKSKIKNLIQEKVPFFVLAGASCVVTVLAQKAGGAVMSLATLPIGARLANALVAYYGYLGKLVWPRGLAVIYTHLGAWPAGTVATAAVVVVGITGLVLWDGMRGAGCGVRNVPMRNSDFGVRNDKAAPDVPSVCDPQSKIKNQKSKMLVGWLWFLGMLVPVIGLLQVGNQYMADRYLYLPAIGLFIMVVWGLPGMRSAECGVRKEAAADRNTDSELRDPACAGRSIRNPQSAIRNFLGAAALGVCAVLTYHQTEYWRDSESLFRHALEVTDNNFVAWSNLGAALDAGGRPEEAEPCYRKALAINPGYIYAYNDLGINLSHLQRYDEAAAVFREALRLEPRMTSARIGLADVLLREGKAQEALAVFEQMVREEPGDAEVRFHFAQALTQQGNVKAAVEQYRWGLQADPEAPDALNNLAWILATNPDPSVRDGARAVSLAERACSLTRYARPTMIGTLAAAYAEAGRFAEAVAAGEKARALAERLNQPDLAARNAQLVELYRAGKAYRE